MPRDVPSVVTPRFVSALLLVVAFAGCAAEPGGTAKDQEHAAEHGWGITSTEMRHLYFEGSCRFLACCAEGDCSLSASSVHGACGTACSDTVPWIARPNGDSSYGCGACVRVCVSGTSHCAEATVWDNSISDGGIEGNVALFNALGLAHSDGTACAGTGGAWVSVSPCTGGAADSGASSTPSPGTRSGPDFAGAYCTNPGEGCGGNTPCWPASDCPSGSTCDWSAGSWGACTYASTTTDPAPSDPPPSDPAPSMDPPPSDPSTDTTACTCDSACDYCWCGTSSEMACAASWNGTGDGCDCGCQFTDPDCGGASSPPSDPGTTFAGVYCTYPGWGCGGNEPCWPASDCPTGSTCDWSAGDWGRCMQ